MVIFGQVASRCPFFNVVHMRCGLFVLRLYWIERLRAHCVRDANVTFWTNNEILFGFGPWRTLSVDRTWHNTIKCLSIHFPVYYLLCHSSYARFAYQWNERTFIHYCITLFSLCQIHHWIHFSLWHSWFQIWMTRPLFAINSVT